MASMAWLYSVTHIKSNRLYIGWTSRPVKARWNAHCWDAANRKKKFYFLRALQKYGKDSFKWEVIQHFPTSEEAQQSEIYWIEHLKQNGILLYNLTAGGEGSVGYKHSEEMRTKLGFNKGKTFSEEWRHNISLAMSSRKLSKTHKEKLSQNKIGFRL